MIDWSHNAESLQCHNEDINFNNVSYKEFLITVLKIESVIGLEMYNLKTFTIAVVESYPSKNKN